MIYTYDIECFPNFFSICFIDATKNNDIDRYIQQDIDNDPDKYLTRNRFATVFMVYDKINDIPQLAAFIKDCKLLIGYNNYAYDDLMLEFILKLYQKGYANGDITSILYKMSASIISYIGYNFRQDNKELFEDIYRPYRSIDLFKLHHLDANHIGLKQVGIALKFYNIKESGVPFEHPIEKEDVSNVIEYNVNDVLITHDLWNKKLEEFTLRVFVSEKYELNVLSASRSGMADKLLAKIYSDATGLKRYEFMRRRTYRSIVSFKEIISDKVLFKTTKLNQFLHELIGTTLTSMDDFKFEKTLIYGEHGYTIATGGLHSIDRPNKFFSTDEMDLTDSDVQSYYPRIMINGLVCPEHLYQAAFTSILIELTEERLQQKASGSKLFAEALKITINSIFGKLGFDGWLLDHAALFKTTINGQLFLLMLIEDLTEVGFDVISANTDGIVTKVPKVRRDEYLAVCDAWMKQTGFILEYSNYTRYIRSNVNSYLAIYDNGKIKQKNEFVEKIEIDKGYNAPVVKMALNAYYVKDIKIDDFLHNHTDIYDFCISQKTGSNWIPEYHTIEGAESKITVLQKNIRYYVSVRGGTLIKRNKEDNRCIRLIAGYNTIVFNKYIPKEMKDYNINYNYYKMRCYEIIDKIEGKTKESITGKLFD